MFRSEFTVCTLALEVSFNNPPRAPFVSNYLIVHTISEYHFRFKSRDFVFTLASWGRSMHVTFHYRQCLNLYPPNQGCNIHCVLLLYVRNNHKKIRTSLILSKRCISHPPVTKSLPTPSKHHPMFSRKIDLRFLALKELYYCPLYDHLFVLGKGLTWWNRPDKFVDKFR